MHGAVCERELNPERVRERDEDKDRQTDRETDKERDRDLTIHCVWRDWCQNTGKHACIPQAWGNVRSVKHWRFPLQMTQ